MTGPPPDPPPGWVGVWHTRELVSLGRSHGQARNLYACPECGAVVTYATITTHREWHGLFGDVLEQIVRALGGTS